MNRVRTYFLATTAVMALSGSAYAADLPLAKAPMLAAIPYGTWEGAYVGGHIGAGRLNASCTETAPSYGYYGGCSSYDASGYGSMNSTSTSATGLIGGVQAGYDWQQKYFVYGVVADWSWTDLKHSVKGASTGATVSTFTAQVDWLASFRGRVGLAVDDTMVYLTGGLALADLKSSSNYQITGATYSHGTLNKVKGGWVAGTGLEHKFGPHWSGFAEVLYYDFGSNQATNVGQYGYSYTSEFTHEITVGRVGVNYRW